METMVKETAATPRMATLGAYVAKKPKSLDPRKFPNEQFELFSVPSHADGKPEVVEGKTVGASKQMVDDDTVLLCKINPRINRTWVVSSHTGHRKIASSEWMTFPPHPDFLPKYLGYYLRQDELREYLSLNASGVGGSLMRAKPSLIKDYPFPLFPLPQQRRIVSAIELQLGRLAAVARLHAAKAKLKRYKQAVLKAAVDYAIENGDMVPLEELITSIGQGWSPKCLNEPSPNNETWGVIKTTAIQPGAYVQEENKELPSPLKPRPEHELKAGDLLVTRAGPRSRVGITCLVRETRPRLMNCDKAYRLRFDAKRVEPAYIEMLLNSPQITDQLDDLKTGISDSGVNLTQGRFLILEMPVIGLKEQRAMISRTQEATASIAEMETTLDAELLQSTRLRQAVLKRAFEGRLV